MFCHCSLWGRLGMNPKKTQHKYFSDPVAFNKLVTSDEVIIKDLNFISDDTQG